MSILYSGAAKKNHNSPMNNLWRPNDRQSLIYSLHAALKVPIFTLDNDPRLYRAQCILWLILFDKYNTNQWSQTPAPPPQFHQAVTPWQVDHYIYLIFKYLLNGHWMDNCIYLHSPGNLIISSPNKENGNRKMPEKKKMLTLYFISRLGIIRSSMIE